MRCLWIGCLLMACIARLTYGTCVLESDFGFILNCNFKKSSLFRVRNLGGVKAHFGLGFSVGDELGFPESLGNLEGNKRRSLSDRDTAAAANSIGVLPASRLPPIQQNRPQALTPATSYKKSSAVAMTEAVSRPLGVPAFRPIPSSISEVGKRANIQPNPVAQNTFNRKTMQQYPTNIMSQLNNLTFATGQPFRAAQTTSNVVQKIPKPMSNVDGVPAFQAMPSSVSRISTGQVVQIDNQNGPSNIQFNPEDVRMPASDSPRIQPQQALPQVDLRGHTVEELALVANVSVETIQNAIRMRQQQLMLEQQASMYKQMDLSKATATPTRPPTRPTTTTTTTTTTTPAPTTPKYVMNGGSKVMNAPKEYYPVGYDKNFDDNFMSKVDLPSTSFHCGDQKHFPGLYADIDLGCMVFHVCALTDDGLIMKSFLCPESTLFDQTVLKCNWWFYVDCKGSRNLYDSNLPVSKSYQLMKALTFFSKYKNNQKDGGSDDGVDVEALKNSVALSDQAH